MANYSIEKARRNDRRTGTRGAARFAKTAMVAGIAVLFIGVTGCQTRQQARVANYNASATAEAAKGATGAPADVLILHEGDALKITFPGAANLNTEQHIRRDGR